MARPDWVPCFNYDIEVQVTGGTQFNMPLMDPTRYGFVAGDVEGVIEEDSGRYFVERIVGTFTMRYLTEPASPVVYHRIWPGYVQENQSVIIAGLLGTVGAANARFWYDSARFVTEAEPWEDHESLAHPHWTHIDIRPKQVCEQNIMPVWSILNLGAAALQVIHHLRALVKPLR